MPGVDAAHIIVTSSLTLGLVPSSPECRYGTASWVHIRDTLTFLSLSSSFSHCTLTNISPLSYPYPYTKVSRPSHVVSRG